MSESPFEINPHLAELELGLLREQIAERRQGCRYFLIVLPGETVTTFDGKFLVAHPTRSPVIMWRDSMGVLREQLCKP